MYQDVFEQASPGPLREFAAAEANLAQNDPSISFIDLASRGITYDQAVANGWMYDGVHPSLAGADAYAQIATDALVPEPSSLLGLSALLILLRRTRSVVRH